MKVNGCWRKDKHGNPVFFLNAEIPVTIPEVCSEKGAFLKVSWIYKDGGKKKKLIKVAGRLTKEVQEHINMLAEAAIKTQREKS